MENFRVSDMSEAAVDDVASTAKDRKGPAMPLASFRQFIMRQFGFLHQHCFYLVFARTTTKPSRYQSIRSKCVPYRCPFNLQSQDCDRAFRYVRKLYSCIA